MKRTGRAGDFRESAEEPNGPESAGACLVGCVLRASSTYGPARRVLTHAHARSHGVGGFNLYVRVHCAHDAQETDLCLRYLSEERSRQELTH